jgi:hypothetical protein
VLLVRCCILLRNLVILATLRIASRSFILVTLKTIRRSLSFVDAVWRSHWVVLCKILRSDTMRSSVAVGSPLLREWYGFRSTSSEHALNTIVVGWKWYDFLKLVRTEDLLIRVSFRVQWVVSWSRAQHMISLDSSMIDSSMNRHWHLFKKW